MFEHCLLTHLQLNPLIDQINQLYDEFKQFDGTNLLSTIGRMAKEISSND